ncbi:MAG TPA: hypothetical protein VGL68_03785 [Solirubrobacteraceae bacterium]|jgi:hypothetical protein
MKTKVFMPMIVIAVFALPTEVAEALASNRTVARQRMTARLLAEHSDEVTYKATEDPASGLVFLEEMEVAEGMTSSRYQSWRPAKLHVSCHARRCTGQLVVTKETSPTYEAEELCASKGGRFVLEGNQGQYPGVTVSDVFVCEREGRKEVITAKASTSETYVALVDHAVFLGRKGTYHETGWEPPS